MKNKNRLSLHPARICRLNITWLKRGVLAVWRFRWEIFCGCAIVPAWVKKRLKMRSIVSVRLVAAVILSASVFFAQGALAASDETPVKREATGGFASYELANGFRIITAPFPQSGTVRVELGVRTGSLQEGYGETGMAHLLEHMLFKGAGARANLKESLSSLGAKWNGTTSPDRTNFFETMAADDERLDELLRLEADRFLRVRFTRDDLASEMTVVRNEMERGENSPESVLFKAVQRQAFSWHGYGRPTIGARSDVEDAPFEALQAFHMKHYRPDNAFLIVSGKFDEKRVVSLASGLFGAARNPQGPRPSTWTRETARPMVAKADVSMPAGKTIATAAWRYPGDYQVDTVALELAVEAFCSHDWGSLKRDMVLRDKKAVSSSCAKLGLIQAGLFFASVSGKKGDDPDAMLESLSGHVEAAAAKGISSESLERARREELNAFEKMESDHVMFARFLSDAEAAGDWRLLLLRRDITKSVTVDDANKALAKWIRRENRTEGVLRHSDTGQTGPTLPRPVMASEVLAGKEWAPLAMTGDAPMKSPGEIAAASKKFNLGPSATGMLISRRTNGDYAWFTMINDTGSEALFSGRSLACESADAMMSHGGGGLSKSDLASRLDALRATAGIVVGGFSMKVPRKAFGEALTLVLSVWRSPLMPEDEFERMRTAAIAGAEAAKSDPGFLAGFEVSKRFDNFPPGHPSKPMGLDEKIAGLKALSYGEMKSCVSDRFGLGRARIALVGDFTDPEAEAVWKEAMAMPDSVRGYERVKNPPIPTEVDVSGITVERPEKPNASVIGVALLPLNVADDDFPALRVAVLAFGSGAKSRVWRRMREREGLAYGAGSDLSGDNFQRRSSFSITASVASEMAETAQKMMKEELSLALRDGFSDSEIEEAKRDWRSGREQMWSEEGMYAGMLADGLDLGFDYGWLATYDKKVSAVTAGEATAAFRKHLKDAGVVWAIGKGSAAKKTP